MSSAATQARTSCAVARPRPGTLRLFGENERGRWSFAERALRHDHLPERTVLLPAEVTVGCAVLDVPDLRVGHIAGPGDEVADGLQLYAG